MRYILAGLTLLLFPTALACGGAVQAGLANAPPLGGTSVADSRVHDVIANGRDSCGRKLDPGPLRYRIFPCPQANPSPHRSTLAVRSTSTGALITPWVEHYYSHWGCLSAGTQPPSWAFST